jgi:Fic family protein
MTLERFVQESNEIERIHVVKRSEIKVHEQFLALDEIRVADIENFVKIVANSRLRRRVGADVGVKGVDHVPPRGGPHIELVLDEILNKANNNFVDPYHTHTTYEALHPFNDGNGRSGRALWAWQMKKFVGDPFALSFLHRWYYQSLQASREI